MRILVVLCLASYAYSAVLDECAQGQSHWCTSLKTAKRCGAVQHCIDNVWSEQAPYAADAGDVCKFCENVISDIRKLFDNQTEARVEQYMDSACGIIPIPELADRCKDYVKNDMPELFKMIRSKLNPGAVCSALCLCSAYKDFTHEPKALHRVALLKASQDIAVRVNHLADKTKTAKTTTADPNLCQDCEKLIKDIKTVLTDVSTETKVEDFLKQKVCSQLGPVEDECSQAVDTYLPELLQLIDDQVDPQMICAVLGLCPNGDRSILPRMRLAKSPLFKSASKIKGNKECDACRVFLSELQDLDRNKVLQADLQDILKEKLCPLLGSLKQECIETVDQYGQFLFEFLANELDPETRCQSLGFCSSANSIHAPARHVSPTRQATPAISKPQKGVKQSVQCVLCEFVMDKLDSMLENNATESEVINALDKVCHILPDTIKEECDKFIMTYGPAILDLLLQELSPQIVCTTLGLCTPSKQAPLLHHRSKVLKTSETCGICETIIQYLDSLLEENATVADIEKALDKVCDALPSMAKDECENFVKQYGPQIIKLVTQLADPKQVCTELGLCQKFSTAMLLKPALGPLVQVKKAPLVGVNKCTYGPAYWCTSRAAAKECGAVAHCNKHGWAKPQN